MSGIDEGNTPEHFHQQMIADNMYSEDSDALPFLIMMGAVLLGPIKESVRGWLENSEFYNEQEFELMWNRAVEQCLFVDGKISVENPDDGMAYVEFILGALLMKGFVERR